MSNDALILLATYNGEAYLNECLLSYPDNCDVFISDDNSRDDTLIILNSYNKGNYKVISQKKNLGSATRNFTYLLNYCDLNYNYYFLSDQDDVWVDDKYELLMTEMRELEQIYGKNKPILIYGDSIVVDEHLSVINESFLTYDGIDVNMVDNFKNVFFQNIAQGATMLINRALLNNIRPVPNDIYMHDWWLMLFAKTTGVLYFSKHKTLLYRQHSSNNIGARKRFLIHQVFNQVAGNGKAKRQLERVKNQLSLFYKTYDSLIKEQEIRDFLSKYDCVKDKSFLKRKFFLISNGIRLSNLKRTVTLYLYF